MKQILQSLKTGITELADVPCPSVKKGQLLIRSRNTLVSAGTERMIVEFGKAGWIDKARQQPDKVSMVLDYLCMEIPGTRIPITVQPGRDIHHWRMGSRRPKSTEQNTVTQQPQCHGAPPTNWGI